MLSFDDLYSRVPARIDLALDAGQAAWEDEDAAGRLALETVMAASRVHLTPANGRAILERLARPRPAWTRWMCACAAPPTITAVSPGFEVALDRWVRADDAMIGPLLMVLCDPDPDLRRFATSGCGRFAEEPACGGPDVVDALRYAEAQGDYGAGWILARHALNHGVHGTLARLLRAPGDAPRGALQALDREPGKARLADLREDLLRLETKGAKGSRECASRILARLHAERGAREELERRLLRGSASVRAHTAAGLRNAAEDGVDIRLAADGLRTLVTRASGFEKRAAEEALASLQAGR
ncbi:MAG: hypothetical protein H6734_10250 [Alphaproteobacteria bacterium]|nr:hypothetical protein [Alphaproteobacteria bacterium]